MNRKDIYILLIIIILLLKSCVQTPVTDFANTDNVIENGDVIVLCEGLLGYDNSDLSLLKIAEGKSITGFYTSTNFNFKLGDTSNDGLLKGDTLITCSTTGAFLNFINIQNGKTIKIVELPSDCSPRKMAIVNDSILAISDLLKSRVIFINIYNYQIIKLIDVGPQPEGIAVYNNLIFTANSAYGDFNYKHPDAQTLSIIDFVNLKEIKKIKTGVNPIEIVINPQNNKIYVAYIHLPSKIDSMGGIIEYDLSSFSKEREWRCNPRSMVLDKGGNKIFFINQTNGKINFWKGISEINLETSAMNNLIYNNSNDIWYGLKIDHFDNSFWVANAKNHQYKGEVLVYSENNFLAPIYRFDTAINPNKFFIIRK